jgi:hypothetical protein
MSELEMSLVSNELDSRHPVFTNSAFTIIPRGKLFHRNRINRTRHPLWK